MYENNVDCATYSVAQLDTTMKRSQRMQFLSDLASGREKTAAQELGEKQTMLRQAELQLEQLVSYREDYSRQFGGGTGGVMQGATLNGYRAFLAGLNRAIDDQSHKIQDHQSECAVSVQHWHETKSRSHALGKATDKIRHLEEQDAARHEQRSIDDLVNASRH